MKTIILTEKPSVAKDFAKALEACYNKDKGYYESDNHVIINAIGHLLQAKKPDEIDAKYKKWEVAGLPILPDELSYLPIDATKKQLYLIKNVIDKVSCHEFIVATDAGREGELIARLILEFCGIKGGLTFKRFWVSEALTPEVIRKGLEAVRPLADYDLLHAAGKARQYADWAVGMNLSRFFSVKTNSSLPVGRVQSAVLNIIAEREKTITTFVPAPYWQLAVTAQNEAKSHTMKGFVYAGTPLARDFMKKDEADALKALFSEVSSLEVTDIKEEEKKERPPLLFSLTALQKEANKKLGFSADKTLKTAQKLYEEYKCLSYPRTPSSVMGESNVELVREKIELLTASYSKLFINVEPALVAVDNKRVFNSAKLEDHHALIPLAALPEAASEEERKLYTLVLYNFAAAFHADHLYKERTVSCAFKESVTLFKGREVVAEGWKALYSAEEKETEEGKAEEERQSLPPLATGDFIELLAVKLLEKKTTPPKSYTEATLLGYMENPKNLETELKVYGIGTPATRAETIEGLLRNGYIERKGKSLLPTEKGFFLVSQVGKTAFKEVLNPVMTSEWEARLESDPAGFQAAIKEFVAGNIEAERDNKEIEVVKAMREGFGACPICQEGTVLENSKSFYCSGYKSGCGFTVWKSMAGAVLTAKDIKLLLAGKATPEKEFTKKDGNTFKAAVKLDENFKTVFVFQERKK
jgi:DNA topoisomerase-3